MAGSLEGVRSLTVSDLNYRYCRSKMFPVEFTDRFSQSFGEEQHTLTTTVRLWSSSVHTYTNVWLDSCSLEDEDILFWTPSRSKRQTFLCPCLQTSTQQWCLFMHLSAWKSNRVVISLLILFSLFMWAISLCLCDRTCSGTLAAVHLMHQYRR